MGADFAIAFVVVVLALIGMFVGLTTRLRSRLLGIGLILFASVGSLGAWYSWMESQSIPWTVGYGVISALALSAALRQFSAVAVTNDAPTRHSVT